MKTIAAAALIATASAEAQPYWGWSGLGSPLVSGHPIGGGLIQNPISGAITPDYTPAQKIEAVRNTVPRALHLGKREAEAEAYYGGYGGYGATIGLHGRNPSAYTGPAYGAVVIGKREAEAEPYYGYGTGYGLGYGTINVNGLILGNPLIANPFTGTVTPDYTPAQKKIVAERYGKREATSEADSYYGYSGLGYGYGAGYGYGLGYGYGKRSADAEAGVASLYGPGYAPIATGAWHSWNYGVWPAGYGKRSADSEADAYYGYGAGLGYGYGAYSNGLGRHYGGAYSYGKRSADSEAYYGGLGYAGYGGIGYGYGGAYTGAYLG